MENGRLFSQSNVHARRVHWAFLVSLFAPVQHTAYAQGNRYDQSLRSPRPHEHPPGEQQLFEELSSNLDGAELAVAPFVHPLTPSVLPFPADVQIIQRGRRPGTIQAFGLQSGNIWVFSVDEQGSQVGRLGTPVEADHLLRESLEASVFGSQLVFAYTEQLLEKPKGAQPGGAAQIPVLNSASALSFFDKSGGLSCAPSCRVRSILKTRDALYLTEKTSQSSFSVQRLGTIRKIDLTDP